MNDLELTNTTLCAKLEVAVRLLGKAKMLVDARRGEINSLKQELALKSKLLHEEMLIHEQTNQKLAKTMHRLAKKYPEKVITIDAPAVAQLENIEELKSE